MQRPGSVVLVLTMAVSSCQLLPIADMPEPPADWTIVEHSGEGQSECPDIGGVYSEVSDNQEYVEGRWIDREPDYRYVVWLISGPASFAGLEPAELQPSQSMAGAVGDVNWIAFDLVGEELIFQEANAKMQKVWQWNFSRRLKHYDCVGGKVVFPVVVLTGGGQGYTRNRQEEVSIGRSSAGALVIYERESLAKPSVFHRGLPRFGVYRFRELQVGQ